MRIYFNGSFCNGKTSLRNWVAKEYDLKSIPEIARTVLAEREISDLSLLRSNTDLLYEVQTEIIERQFNVEKEAKDNFVCCRGLDSAAFLLSFSNQQDCHFFVTEPLFRRYVEWIRDDSVYTFLVKPDKSLMKNDGLRDTDWNLSMEIFGMVKCLLRSNAIDYTLISDTNMSERQAIIRNVLDGKVSTSCEEL